MFVQTAVVAPEELTFSLVKRAKQTTVSMSVAMGLLIFGLLYLTINYSALVLTYCVYQFFVVLFVVSSGGLLGQLLPSWSPAHIDLASGVLFVARVALTVILCWSVFAIYPTSRLFQMLALALLIGCVINVLLMVAGHRRLGLQLNYAVFVLNPFVQILGLLSAEKMERRRRNILMGWLGFFIVVTGVGSLNAFGGMLISQRTDMLQHFGDWRLSGGIIGSIFFWAVVSEQTARNLAKSREMEQLRLEAEKARAGEEKLSERGALIDMLTHELKNPLGTIKFALASLKRLARPDADSGLRFQNIDASVNRMDDLIHHVAQSNKIELMDLSDEIEAIPAQELVQDLVGDYDAGRLAVSIEEGAFFRADRQLLQVIVENLLSNAFKYAVPNSKIAIDITLERRANHAPATSFQISNRVEPGAEPDEARLFERYYRHTQAQSQPGMGIGLSLVRSAAKKINGSVNYAAQGDQVVFTVRVPT